MHLHLLEVSKGGFVLLLVKLDGFTVIVKNGLSGKAGLSLLILDDQGLQLMFIDFEHIFLVFFTVLVHHFAVFVQLRRFIGFKALGHFHLFLVIVMLIDVIMLVFWLDFNLLLHALDAHLVGVLVFLVILLLIHVGIFHLLVAFFIDNIVFFLGLHLVVEHLLLLNLLELAIFIFFIVAFFVLTLITLVISLISSALFHALAHYDPRRWEVGSLHVQLVIVLGRDEQLTLLLSQVFVRVHARLTKNLNVTLKLFYLRQVVDERF